MRSEKIPASDIVARLSDTVRPGVAADEEVEVCMSARSKKTQRRGWAKAATGTTAATGHCVQVWKQHVANSRHRAASNEAIKA